MLIILININSFITRLHLENMADHSWTLEKRFLSKNFWSSEFDLLMYSFERRHFAHRTFTESIRNRASIENIHRNHLQKAFPENIHIETLWWSIAPRSRQTKSRRALWESFGLLPFYSIATYFINNLCWFSTFVLFLATFLWTLEALVEV